MRGTFVRDGYRKEVKPGDYKQALWDQYQNCYNSLNTLETEADTRGSKGVQFSQMESHVSIEKFVGNVDILEGMMYSRQLVESLSVSHSFEEGQKKFADLGKILIAKVWVEKTEDLGMV